MNTILIVMAVYLVPMMLAGVLYSVEWIAERVAVYFEEHEL